MNLYNYLIFVNITFYTSLVTNKLYFRLLFIFVISLVYFSTFCDCCNIIWFSPSPVFI